MIPKLGCTPGRANTAACVVIRYALAGSLVAIATAVEAYLPLGSMPLLLFYPAVLLVAWRLGRGPAFFSIAASSVCIAYWFLPPDSSIRVAAARDLVDLALFAGISSLVVCLIDRARAAAARSRTLFECSPIPVCEEDFSAVKEALDALRAADVRDLRAYFEAHPAEVARIEGLIRITDINGRFVELFGAAGKASTSRRVLDYLDERANRVVGDFLAALAAGALDQTLEMPIRTPQGQPMDIVVSLTVAPESRRTWSRVIVSFFDVTARVRAEAALRDEDRRKSEFLAVLSHELRNPLAPIRNSLYVLDRAPPGSEVARRAVAVIDRQVTQLTRLVGDLLDMTRIARGKIDLQRREVALASLVRDTAEDHRRLFDDAGLRFEVRIGADAVRASCDPARIAQVVGNLLNNAVKFTERGGHVVLSLDEDGASGMAEIRVRDTGTGIPPALLPRLFTPFTQDDRSLARSRGGLGLGLALSRGLVELHGGVIEATSDGPGKGTEVIVRLPGAPAGADAAATGPSPPRSSVERPTSPCA